MYLLERREQVVKESFRLKSFPVEMYSTTNFMHLCEWFFWSHVKNVAKALVEPYLDPWDPIKHLYRKYNEWTIQKILLSKLMSIQVTLKAHVHSGGSMHLRLVSKQRLDKHSEKSHGEATLWPLSFVKKSFRRGRTCCLSKQNSFIYANKAVPNLFYK